jgi:dienelactone hydrolase
MKILYALLILLFSSLFMFGQYDVGSTTITFNDASRTGGFGSGGGAGRQIQSEIYYPATVAGVDATVASGDFPVIVFGHGFVMSWDAYENIWQEVVARGYIMVFPRTEGGFSPSHDEFGMDLALLVGKMQALNTDVTSLFNGHVSTKSAIMGHSMGGGAAFLASANNTAIETVIGLAPAETTPSAEAAAANVSAPALILSGSGDGVTPPADHHQPIYDNLGSSCKHFISLTGGAHCYFANANFNCDFGEGSPAAVTVTRTEQHQITFDYINKWLDYKLKEDCAAFSDFNALMTSDTRITYQDDCTDSSPLNTVAQSGAILTADESGATYQWLDCNNGNAPISGATSQFYSAQVNGDYAVEIVSGGCVVTSACYSIMGLGIAPANVVKVSVFPNPTNGIININSSESGVVRITDVAGKLILDVQLKIGNNEIDLSTSNGVYLYSVTNTSRFKTTGKIIVK